MNNNKFPRIVENPKRIVMFMGHYGSGKTNIAVNYALALKKLGKNVRIADLDIVNPYFRTKDSMKELNEAKIELICSEYANSNVDIPALPQNMYSVTDDKTKMAVLDIGGDDRGAYALGRLVPEILKENSYEMLMVINGFRPLTRDAKSTYEVMKEIEFACKMQFTGLINNSNIGNETGKDEILQGMKYAKEVSEYTGLPIEMTTVNETLYDELKDEIPDLFKMKLQKKII